MRFYTKLNQGEIPRLGDLIKDAKTVLDILIRSMFGSPGHSWGPDADG